jgi:rifampin ADP-ribosylating transferase
MQANYPTPLYHGTRTHLEPGEFLHPNPEPNGQRAIVYLTSNLDAAIWAAETADGDDPPHVYRVDPTGPVEDISEQKPPGPPAMTLCSHEALRIVNEVTEWTHYHGTKADLKIGDLIQPGREANFGPTARTANYVYFARTLDAAVWGAELATGEAPGRVYIVEPGGPFEDDPNLTNQKFRGNPTKSFRSRDALRVIGEVRDWQPHPAELVQAMKDNLARLNAEGIEPMD